MPDDILFYYYDLYANETDSSGKDAEINLTETLDKINSISKVKTELPHDSTSYTLEIDNKEGYYFGRILSPKLTSKYYKVAKGVPSNFKSKKIDSLGYFKYDYSNFLMKKNGKNLILMMESGFQTAGGQILCLLLMKLVKNQLTQDVQINKIPKTNETFKERYNKFKNEEIASFQISLKNLDDKRTAALLSKIASKKVLNLYNNLSARISIKFAIQYVKKDAVIPKLSEIFSELTTDEKVKELFADEVNLPDFLSQFDIKRKGVKVNDELMEGYVRSKVFFQKEDSIKKSKELFKLLKTEFENKKNKGELKL
ncbi:MAG: hypothetical protein NTY48_03925 [Candidatus Diapherotrites archaeon]|nr:hypothetical protein [Candidatus Diapherotrites archaeon]